VSSRDVVRDGYDRLGARYLEWTRASPVRLRVLDEILTRLEPDSDVVELGCGPGEPVTRALAERHTVTAVDLSGGQLALARQAAPAATFVHADVTQLDLPPESADAVVALYLFGHLPPATHAPLLRKIATWLKPGGFTTFSTPAWPGDGVDDDWLGVPMYFGGLATEDTLAALAVAGLTVERAETLAEDEDGTRVEFLWITARKA
jgi:SAM-dependent methyltransferase